MLIKCIFKQKKFTLYCIISGPVTFIEEEIAKLIEFQLHKKVDLSGIRNSDWKARIKREIFQFLKENDRTIKELIEQTGKEIIERSFPNICAVFKKIEENFQI